jgi:hypothetical protein
MAAKYPCPACYKTRAQGSASSCIVCLGKGTVDTDCFERNNQFIDWHMKKYTEEFHKLWNEFESETKASEVDLRKISDEIRETHPYGPG